VANGITRHPRWPHESLDVAALRAGGWRPRPFRDFVLKVHQRCNLACDYCYIYEMADQGWRDRPAVMPEHVVRAAADRIGEHARAHDLPEVRLILHGGEPLLAGPARLRSMVTTLRAALPESCRHTVGLQTNGALLDERMLGVLKDLDVKIGVSLDGPPAAHDSHRRRADGRGSFALVNRALTRLASPENRTAYAGLLCTVDPATDPLECFETLLSYRPPAVDFLLPHANWDQPPAGKIAQAGRAGRSTPYAEWLIPIFDRWYDADRQETRVRLFESIIDLILGGASVSEQVGLSPVAVAVVESDGAIEQDDALKSAYAGAGATGLNVLTDPFDAALAHPGIAARQIGLGALADECLACPLHEICGGGHYVHRYRGGDGFRNPSVYCADLRVLITHVRRRVTDGLARLAEARRA
jgi:uncharacterized protein